jgi:hypothetical protein
VLAEMPGCRRSQPSGVCDPNVARIGLGEIRLGEISLGEIRLVASKIGLGEIEPKICELVALARVLTTRMDPDGMRNQTSAIP